MIENKNYIISYSNRKTIEIKINEKGEVHIKAPSQISQIELMAFIDKKKKWINEKQYIIFNRKKLKDDELLYKGEIYKVKIHEQPYIKRNFVCIDNKVILVSVKDVLAWKVTLERWLKEEALKTIIATAEKYMSKFDSEPNIIKVKEQKRKWGSCSYDNKLYFNWRLIMAPITSLEYVVIHELCHMTHKNHSKKFWDLVYELCPNYKEYHNWLRDNGYLLY